MPHSLFVGRTRTATMTLPLSKVRARMDAMRKRSSILGSELARDRLAPWCTTEPSGAVAELEAHPMVALCECYAADGAVGQ